MGIILPKQEDLTAIPHPSTEERIGKYKGTRFLIATNVEGGLNITLDPQARWEVERVRGFDADVYLPGGHEVRGSIGNGSYADRPGESNP